VGVLERVGAGEFERAVERPQPALELRQRLRTAATTLTAFASGIFG
jgi:hypothetical protein